MTTPDSVAHGVFERLLADTSSVRSRAAITGLWVALNAMRDAKENDYSIASVARYCTVCGGPKQQSIRNSPRFKDLIAAFVGEGGSTSMPSRGRKSGLETAIESISDMGARLAIRLAIEEGRRLGTENDRLRAAFKRLSIGGAAAVSSGRQKEIPSHLVDAVELFLSDEWIHGHFWSVREDGAIIDDLLPGRAIAPPGFVEALRVLAAHEKR